MWVVIHSRVFAWVERRPVVAEFESDRRGEQARCDLDRGASCSQHKLINITTNIGLGLENISIKRKAEMNEAWKGNRAVRERIAGLKMGYL